MMQFGIYSPPYTLLNLNWIQELDSMDFLLENRKKNVLRITAIKVMFSLGLSNTPWRPPRWSDCNKGKVPIIAPLRIPHVSGAESDGQYMCACP